MFSFTPSSDMHYILEIPAGKSNVKKYLDIESYMDKKDKKNEEIMFAITNDNHVLDNDEDLKIKFYTNNKLQKD